jgi:hypothetical protein
MASLQLGPNMYIVFRRIILMCQPGLWMKMKAVPMAVWSRGISVAQVKGRRGSCTALK